MMRELQSTNPWQAACRPSRFFFRRIKLIKLCSFTLCRTVNAYDRSERHLTSTSKRRHQPSTPQ